MKSFRCLSNSWMAYSTESGATVLAVLLSAFIIDIFWLKQNLDRRVTCLTMSLWGKCLGSSTVYFKRLATVVMTLLHRQPHLAMNLDSPQARLSNFEFYPLFFFVRWHPWFNFLVKPPRADFTFWGIHWDNNLWPKYSPFQNHINIFDRLAYTAKT